MKTIKRLAVFLWKGKKTVNYLPWACLPPIALLAALFFTYAQQSAPFLDALHNKRFLVAAAWSLLPAVLVLFYIQALTYVLDLKFCRRKDQWERVKKQLLWGILVPGLFLVSYYTIYYNAYGKSIFKRKYFQIEFPMALTSIAGINVAYMFRYLYLQRRREEGRYKRKLADSHLEKTALLTDNIRQRKELALLKQASVKQSAYPEEIIVNRGEQQLVVSVKEIVCIMRWDQVGIIMLSTGGLLQMDNTVDSLLSLLDDSFFLKSNRWCIINLAHVAYTGYENENYSRIVYKKQADLLFSILDSQVGAILKAHGKSEHLIADKYKLSRSFRKAFEERLEALWRLEV